MMDAKSQVSTTSNSYEFKVCVGHTANSLCVRRDEQGYTFAIQCLDEGEYFGEESIQIPWEYVCSLKEWINEEI